MSMNKLAPPISSTPFCMVRRSESALSRWGKYESCARFAITRGPAMKPACAATNSSRASDASVATTNQSPRGSPKGWTFPASIFASVQFIVLPSMWWTPSSR